MKKLIDKYFKDAAESLLSMLNEKCSVDSDPAKEQIISYFRQIAKDQKAVCQHECCDNQCENYPLYLDKDLSKADYKIVDHLSGYLEDAEY